jgi:hypothetical protein
MLTYSLSYDRHLTCSTAIIDHLEQRHDCATAYVYFDYQERLTQSATNVVLSLLKQLLHCLAPKRWPKPLFEMVSKNASDIRNSLDGRQVLTFIFHCARQFSKVFFIFDALDECEDVPSRSKLIDFINTATQLEPCIRILLTSRPQLPANSFGNHSAILVRALDRDIETYTRASIKHKSYSSVLQDEIVNKIVASSGGLYIPVNDNNLI